ncbi:MAG: hypothetical protein M0Z64_03410 [Nitrospiraceae bacterium]|nr:hypothetical protein [Nitrospiraceae bacterium]
MEKKLKATEEQLTYSKILDLGMKVGLLALVITFIIYLTGIFTPHIPVNDLPKYWGMSVQKYLEATHIPHGWGWLGMVGKGDFLNFIGIAFLAGVTTVCYIAIIPILFRKKDTVYGMIAIVEVLVLVLAASGILKSGGH